MKRVILAMLSAVCLAGAAVAQQLSTTPVSRMGEKWWSNRFEANRKSAQSGGYDIVFLGDSITDFWRNRGRAEFEKYFGEFKTLNMGYSADRTEHVLWRLDNGELNGANAKLIVLMIGTNNTGHRFQKEKEQDTVDGIRAILDRIAKIAPNTKTLLLPIFPRSGSKSDAMRVRNDAVNAKIKAFADNKRVFWIDFNNQLLEKDGTLSKEIMPDLLHPNAKGYTIWAESILPFVRKTVRRSVIPEARSGWWMNRFNEKCALAKAKKWNFVFLGDSIVHGWEGAGKKEWKELIGPYQVFNAGYGADRTEHVLWRLDHGELDGINPKLIFVMIGTNNTGHNNAVQERPEDTAAGIRAILDRLEKIAPNAKIVLHPIFPRGETPKDGLRIRNEKVNALIRGFVNGRNILWLDFNDRFLTKEGTLTREIMGDLLHPTPKGYVIWFNAVKPLLDQYQ